MLEKSNEVLQSLYTDNIMAYLKNALASPWELLIVLLDIGIVVYLAVKLLQIVKNTRAWQLLKGIAFLILTTVLSGLFGLRILNFILTSFMAYGVLLLIVIFQPELRRGLEQLGTSKITKFFGIDKDIASKTKENIYKIVIAALELSKDRVGGLIVIERDIKIKDIVNTGIIMNAEISPQVLVNIFTPNTPLHDGAVTISDNKIAAAACMLPLASDQYIAKELGTRHRAAIGISKESDAIAVVISEETGKISVAKDGTLIADLKEEALKKLLIKNIVINRFEQQNSRKANINNWKNRFKHKHDNVNKKEDQIKE